MNARRAPSYKAIAIAILKNDHNLHSLGFAQKESPMVNDLIRIRKESEDCQQRLRFD